MDTFKTSYSHDTVDMLLTNSIIAKDFKANIHHFSPIRTPWNEGYAEDLIIRNDKALSDLVGVDHRGELRESTTRVERIMDNAKADLRVVKTNIRGDFDGEVAREILTKLGYSRYFDDVIQNNDQESLMSLLNNFRNSMTDELRALITSGGTRSEFIDQIIGYASEFQEANVAQEELKVHWNEPSIEARKEFQSLYDEVIRICKIGRIIFRDNPEMRDRFTYSRVMAKVTGNRAARKEEEDREAAEDAE